MREHTLRFGRRAYDVTNGLRSPWCLYMQDDEGKVTELREAVGILSLVLLYIPTHINNKYTTHNHFLKEEIIIPSNT